jgi:hypothetical protein
MAQAASAAGSLPFIAPLPSDQTTVIIVHRYGGSPLGDW